MDRIRSLAIGGFLLFAPVMLAQQTVTEPGRPLKGPVQASDLPDVGNQLKVLTQKLDLTADQQPKVKGTSRNCMKPRKQSCRTKPFRAINC